MIACPAARKNATGRPTRNEQRHQRVPDEDVNREAERHRPDERAERQEDAKAGRADDLCDDGKDGNRDDRDDAVEHIPDERECLLDELEDRPALSARAHAAEPNPGDHREENDREDLVLEEGPRDALPERGPSAR